VASVNPAAEVGGGLLDEAVEELGEEPGADEVDGEQGEEEVAADKGGGVPEEVDPGEKDDEVGEVEAVGDGR
jgi:hypothetical protein